MMDRLINILLLAVIAALAANLWEIATPPGF